MTTEELLESVGVDVFYHDAKADISIVCGDAREVIPSFWPNPIWDVVITDPPYGISHSSNHGASWQGKQIAGDSDTETRDQVLGLLDCDYACFGTWKTHPPYGASQCIVWNKGPAFGMGNLAMPWKPSWEMIYIRGDGWSGRRDEGVLSGHIVVSWESKGRMHPHQKPVSLISELLRKRSPSDFVIDPFSGSGSTAIACKRLGRKCLCIESDREHWENSKQRLKNEPMPMFVEQAEPVKQPELFTD